MMWTEERVATLRKLWAEGLSASQIAKQLGGVTRNAVIGK
ncbi:MAG TPA: GcrA family cell cycle regulator, partial [Terricaulis sp.]|nr:GcrA family cell cycle regulator [Terricaulis sp.]